MSGQGAGRRLTAEETERARQLLAAGHSQRQVAKAIGVAPATIHRLSARLGTASPAPGTADQETTVTDQTPAEIAKPGEGLPASRSATAVANSAADGQADDAELTRLRTRQEELAAEVAMYAGRCDSSRQAVADLEAERLQLLASRQDAQHLRSRRRDAEDDFADSATAAQITQDALGVVGQQIAVVEARQADRRLRAELAGAVAERDQVLAGIGGRQRAAVLAVRQAAEAFVLTFADEQRVTSRVDELAARLALGGPAPAVPPAAAAHLPVPADAVARAPVALLRAMRQARERNVTAVAEQLGVADGYVPPDPAELEAERQRMIALRAGMPAPQAPGSVPARQFDPRYGSTVNLDANGNPLTPRPPQQLPVPAAQQAPPSGWLGGQPFR